MLTNFQNRSGKLWVVNPKSDPNLQENLARSQNFVIWAWICDIWSIKINFSKVHIFCTSAIMECQNDAKMDFSEL